MEHATGIRLYICSVRFSVFHRTTPLRRASFLFRYPRLNIVEKRTDRLRALVSSSIFLLADEIDKLRYIIVCYTINQKDTLHSDANALPISPITDLEET